MLVFCFGLLVKAGDYRIERKENGGGVFSLDGKSRREALRSVCVQLALGAAAVFREPCGLRVWKCALASGQSYGEKRWETSNIFFAASVVFLVSYYCKTCACTIWTFWKQIVNENWCQTTRWMTDCLMHTISSRFIDPKKSSSETGTQIMVHKSKTCGAGRLHSIELKTIPKFTTVVEHLIIRCFHWSIDWLIC